MRFRCCLFFFCKQNAAYEMRISDWSSDVCSSDLVGYTLLTGSEVPTIRSCVAALLVLGGLALGREAITLRLIASGAIFVMLFWPEAVAGPSFQLSFAAVTAIVALHEHRRFHALVERRDEGLIARFCRSLLALFLTGIAVELTLSPIALYHRSK